MKVLVADDNLKMRDHLADLLENEGFQTIRVNNGTEALEAYQNNSPEFLCLDIVMPDLSGYDVCREVRKNDPAIPILFISSKSESIDKVLGLELGADDYIVKPYEIHEVIARIRAIARRCLTLKENDNDAPESFTMLHLTIRPQQLRAEKDGETVDLSLRELKILELLYNNKNKVVDRDTLLDHCWGTHITPESRTVDWHIAQLRKKVEQEPESPKIIQTVRGVGYRFEE